MTIKKLTVAAAIAVGIATCSFSSANAACPCSGEGMHNKRGCQQIVTPQTAKCPLAEQEPCGCDKKSDCNKCPTTSCEKLDTKQVYAYPNAIYGDNNYVGEQSNAIYSTETAWGLDRHEGMMLGAAAPLDSCKKPEYVNKGVPVSRGCGNEMKSITGAACGACGKDLPVITGGAAPCGCGENLQKNQIESQNSIEAIKKSFVPFTPSDGMTGAAAPLINVFPDVPCGYWAGCDINRLAATNVVAGYPDRTFKPSLPVSRAEFASMLVKGFNYNIAGCDCLNAKKLFKDVPLNNWANPAIAKAVEEGLMSGYNNGKFMPRRPVSRTEALTAMAHGINCEMDECKAKSILSQYCDGNKVPEWATIPVAKALETGVLKCSPSPSTISPCKDASRADIASMLQSVRIAAGYDKDPTPTASNCPCGDKSAYMETSQIVQVPTLKVKFMDEINAKSSHVGQQFAAKTTEDITINGVLYPCGSRVNGKIVEVIRPSGCQKGALKVAFTNIEGCDGCKVELPRQVLSAHINCEKKPNAVARFVSMPFTLVGSLAGTIGRTAGGMLSNTGNAIENVTNGTGIAFGETMQGQFRAAGRSLQDAGKALVIAPVDFTRTALSGTTGLLQTTGDEVAYLVDPNGNKISAINPKEEVTIAFGD